jgi:hypothetical protein
MKNFDRLKTRLTYSKEGERVRTVIALDGFYINALASIGVEQKDVPAWLKSRLSEWKAFNPSKPITQQLKGLIVLNLIESLGGNTDPFFK